VTKLVFKIGYRGFGYQRKFVRKN